jgi:hypothetical protein
MQKGMLPLMLMLTTCAGSVATAEPDIKLDGNGCRELSKLPPPGVHPRVFFTADEYPRIKARLDSPRYKEKFGPVHQRIVDGVKRGWRAFAELDLDSPTDEQILKYFVSGEGRNQQWGIAAVTAVLNDDVELKELMKKVIVNYARIILASKERSVGGNIVGKTGVELNKRLNVWRDSAFGCGTSWLFGSAGYPLAFDVLYNDMTPEQRAVVTEALAAATRGRRPYGSGMPRGFAVSNHYGYHGDLLALMAVIEDEPGFDQATWDNMFKIMQDYWEVGFTRKGYCHEDGYGPNLGLRAGLRGLIVMSRRGYNIFPTEKFRSYLDCVAMEWDPYPGGPLNGGASGGPYGTLYPTSCTIARYMYPESPAANFSYRHLLGDDFGRGFRWQGHLDFFLYGSDWRGPETRQGMLEATEMPLSVYYPERGKFVARSDWSDEAMYLTLDARPDAHTIGHDKVDRGNFSMSALGRVWAFAGDWGIWKMADNNSLVHIDGKAEAWKAPSVRFVWTEDRGDIAAGAADLKYAYDWQWSPPWPAWGKEFPAPWEPETNGPIDLGLPEGVATPETPKRLHGSQTGYAGRNNLHRQPFNKVQKALRSATLIRGTHPYAIICDDIRKDAAEHLYEWYMQLPNDLVLRSQEDNTVVLKETGDGGREMLVLFLQQARCSVKVESYVVREATGGKKPRPAVMGNRLIAPTRAIEPEFKVLLYPYRAGETPPKVAWTEDGTKLTVDFGDQTDELQFGPADATRVLLSRD